MSSPTQLRALYRALLRELPIKTQTTHTTHQKLSAASPLQKRLRAQIAATAPTASSTPHDTQRLESQTAQAAQFLQYLHAQRTYATLIERYNPGMGMSEEERVRLSARRIGMNLPVEFGEGE
ncbi:hypothetical protein C7974DRAFT_412412 [Boeremia exigua]|uniref:uncharacterized protein n=1 Tax=Boeremia exigua TaxID=749465 RepID=UPI001E8DBF32|nr:uncharacterized protein C7974DRAFT_412412 [Boeremia exigua]KAH6633417.1 hypothetical protein C7974DRAFT_412412 [Boeremia exigua]